MKSRRYEKLVRQIEAEYPGTRVVVDPYTTHDGFRDIRWFVHILDCPARLRFRAEDYAYHRALELWGGMSFPFFIDAYGPRATRRYLAERAARARPRRAPAPRGRTLLGARSGRSRRRRGRPRETA